MKKKVFSKLLMGALLVASVSSFTSCKDYDDDINDLRSQINGLNTSLNATVTDKLATVNSQITSLTTQLNEVKSAYATADAGLKESINALADGGALNSAAILELQKQVVNLAAADGNLSAAIETLTIGLNAANATLKEQGETLVSLAAVDLALEKSIEEAKAQAANALAEAQKAQTAAANNAIALASLSTELSKTQESIAKSLSDVNTKIESGLAALESRVVTLETKVGDLIKENAANVANLTTINTKLAELAATDKSISDALDAAKTKLADDQKAAVENLQKQITANAAAIQTINEKTVEDLAKHVIPDEVNKQLAEALPEALKDYMKTTDILALVDEKTAAAKTLAEAIQTKLEQDDAALKNYIDGEFLLAVKSLISGSEEKTAGEWKAALKEANDKLAGDIAAINDQLNTEKEGSLANALKAAQVALGTDVATLQKFFQAEDGAALSIDNLVSQIAGTTGFAKAMKEAADEANGEVLGAITSISLFYNGHHGVGGLNGHSKVFFYAVENDNKFPIDKDSVKADSQYVFKKDILRTYGDSVIVRVSPVTVKLSKKSIYENIALLNSKGEDLVKDSIIEIEDVTPYNESHGYLTRAAEGNETGLWVVKFKLTEGEGRYDKFKEAVETEVNGAQRQILYAIAVKNMDIAGKDADGNATTTDRYVVSDYDLTFGLQQAQRGYDFWVNDISVNLIHNRYIRAEQRAFDGSYLYTEDKAELTWLDPADVDEEKVHIPWTEAILDGDNANAKDRRGWTGNHNTVTGEDNRQTKPVLNVEIGKPIKISYSDPARVKNNQIINTRIRGFYVTLDERFAVESNTSELSAWCSYQYENVGYTQFDPDGKKSTVKPAHMFDGNEGEITIKNAMNAKGDIIGFRVYAVNLDGTLCDPDGRAFYVKFGTGVDTDTLKYTIKPTQTVNQAAAEVTKAFNRGVNVDKNDKAENFFSSDDANWNWSIAWGDNNPDIVTSGSATPKTANSWVKIKAGTYTNITNIFAFDFKTATADYDNYADAPAVYNDTRDDINKLYFTKQGTAKNIITDKTTGMKVMIKNANWLQDGKTYYLVLTGSRFDKQDGQEQDTKKIVISVTKVNPVGLPSNFGFKNNQDYSKNALTFYLRPNTAANGTGSSWNVAQLPADQNEWSFPIAANWVKGGADIYHAKDVKPYDFTDIFEGLSLEYNANGGTSVWDENYKFEFPETDFANDAKATDKAVSTYAKYEGAAAVHYSLPVVYKNAIGKEIGVNVTYLYKEVSLKKDENDKPVQKDIEQTKENYMKAKFACTLEQGTIAKMSEAEFTTMLTSTPATAATNLNDFFTALDTYLNDMGFTPAEKAAFSNTEVSFKVRDKDNKYKTDEKVKIKQITAGKIINGDKAGTAYDATEQKAAIAAICPKVFTRVNDNTIFYEMEFANGGAYYNTYGTPNKNVKFATYMYKNNTLNNISYPDTDLLTFLGGSYDGATWKAGTKTFAQMVEAGFYLVPDQDLAVPESLKDYFKEVKLNAQKTGLEFTSKEGAGYSALTKDLKGTVNVKYYDVFGHPEEFKVEVVMKRPETTLSRRANF